MKNRKSFDGRVSVPWGGIVDRELSIAGQCQAQGKSGAWHNARPEPYRSIWERFKLALDVLRYKADAIYWKIDFDK